MLDLFNPVHLSLAYLPDIVLIAGAMLVLLGTVWNRDAGPGATRGTSLSAIAVCVVTLGAVVWASTQNWVVDGHGPIAADNFRWVMDGIVLVAAILTLMLAMDHDPRARISAREAPVLVLLAVAGMMLLSGARDLILVFLGIELMSVSVYVLASLDRRSARSSEAGLKYFLLGAFSSAFLLYGVALIYGASGSTNILVIGEMMATPMSESPMLFVGLALLLVGFAFKVSSVPFHMWTPDVYDGTPTPYAGFMAAAVKAASFAALLRVVLEGSAGTVERWHVAVWYLAAATMIVGNVVAVQQRNVKRLLAYSSIAHAGFLLVAVAAQTPAGGAAILFYLVAYTLATIGAFAVVVALSDGSSSAIDVSSYAGLFSVQPRMAMAMAVFMLALLGFPLAGGMGFFAKWYVLQAALQAPAPQTRLAILLVLMTVVSASFYLYVIMVMFMQKRPDDAPAIAEPPKLTSSVIFMAAVVILVFGLYPSPVVRLARASTIGVTIAPQVPAPSAPPARMAASP